MAVMDWSILDLSIGRLTPLRVDGSISHRAAAAINPELVREQRIAAQLKISPSLRFSRAVINAPDTPKDGVLYHTSYPVSAQRDSRVTSILRREENSPWLKQPALMGGTQALCYDAPSRGE
jgi:hypothetical protein